jgi:hypothetical protein
MKWTKNKLREIKIYNSYEIAKIGGGNIYISYIPACNSYAEWRIVGIGFKTDPTGHWQNNYCKPFTVTCKENKIPQLEKAKEWVKEKYHIEIEHWEKDSFGDYQIIGIIKTAIDTQLEKQLNDKPNE